MTTKVAFKAMYKTIGFSDDAATELTDTEVVDSRHKLSRITSVRASKICKAIRSPGGAGAGLHVTEGAEHSLVIAAAVSLNAFRVSRNIECVEIRLDPLDLFDLHKGQQLLEGQLVTEFMFVRYIDSDAARRGVLLGIEVEGGVLGLQDR